jgi:hypothetical protein
VDSVEIRVSLSPCPRRRAPVAHHSSVAFIIPEFTPSRIKATYDRLLRSSPPSFSHVLYGRGRTYGMGFTTFTQYVAMQEGLLAPDCAPAKGLSRLNPFPTTNAHRRRIIQPKARPLELFGPVARPLVPLPPQTAAPVMP